MMLQQRPLAPVRGAIRIARRLRGRLQDPAFLIIGAQRAGTSSAFRYLCDHPAIRPPVRKELHYFDLNHHRGDSWYRASFPSPRPGTITGEATPSYLFFPSVPDLVAELVPDCKLIVLLRDPVERAISQFRYSTALGHETLTLNAALDVEADRLASEAEVRGDEAFQGVHHLHHSYTSRGMYAAQLARWLARFDRQRFFVASSERLYTDPAGLYADLVAFLGLEQHHLDTFQRFNATRAADVDADDHRRLVDTFAAPNQELFDLLGERFDWS